MNENSKSQQLLNKVYEHLDTIDVSKLPLRELEDFLGVVQKCQFLESFGKTSALGFGGFGYNNKPSEPAKDGETEAK